MRKGCVVFIVSLLLFAFSSGLAFAVPSEPPPAGKIWVEINGQWVLVVAPPGEGPYIWKESRWMLDTAPPPPDSDWIPGHWAPGHVKGKVMVPGHWIPGHWETVASPGPGSKWVPGHWKGNAWISGHWAGTAPRGKDWVPAHRGPGGQRIPGHWR